MNEPIALIHRLYNIVDELMLSLILIIITGNHANHRIK